MTTPLALIIDDEPDIRELISLTLMRMGVECRTAKNVSEARRQLQETTFSFCLTDMKLPDGNGIEIVKLIQAEYDATPVAVITAHGNMDTAIECLKLGAFDFVNKPVDLASLRSLVDAAISSSKLPDKPAATDDIIGESAAVIRLKSAIKKLARSQAPVYIAGESGSGKELVARSIHKLGARSSNPFVPVNCGAIPSELVESEFFGYKKGSFTGASRDSEGLFQAANGGTLFLDEVADLPLSMQVKILRAIQERAVRPIGAQNEINIDVRVLCATHKDLQALVSSGEFRQDLFYRLNVIQLDVPPLRERQEDIPRLIDHVLARLDLNADIRTRVTKAAIDALMLYSFPGNIRELENILERAFTLCENNTVDTDDLNLTEHSSNIRNESKASHFRNTLTYGSIDDYLAEIEKEILLEAS